MTFCKYVPFRLRTIGLRDGIQNNQDDGLRRRKGVTEIDECGDEDQEVDDQRPKVGESHGGDVWT